MKPSGEVFGPLPEIPSFTLVYHHSLLFTLQLSTFHSLLFLSTLSAHYALATAFSHYIVPLFCTEIAFLLDQISAPERKSSPKLNTGFADPACATNTSLSRQFEREIAASSSHLDKVFGLAPCLCFHSSSAPKCSPCGPDIAPQLQLA